MEGMSSRGGVQLKGGVGDDEAANPATPRSITDSEDTITSGSLTT